MTKMIYTLYIPPTNAAFNLRVGVVGGGGGGGGGGGTLWLSPLKPLACVGDSPAGQTPRLLIHPLPFRHSTIFHLLTC